MLELFAITLNNVFQQLKGSNKEVSLLPLFIKLKPQR